MLVGPGAREPWADPKSLEGDSDSTVARARLWARDPAGHGRKPSGFLRTSWAAP